MPAHCGGSRDLPTDFDKEELLERLAKLAGCVAQINVLAATEPEMKERKFATVRHKIPSAAR